MADMTLEALDYFDNPEKYGATYRMALECGKTLAAEVRRRQWIPVGERLPEDGETVIASRCNSRGEIMTWSLSGYHPGQGPRFIADRFNHGAGNDYGDVTHWMPRPEPPTPPQEG